MNLLKHWAKLVLRPAYRQEQAIDRSLAELRRQPRYQAGQTTLLGAPLYYSDAASVAFIYEEIFRKGIYSFRAKDPQNLRIIDGGANIGLGLIYFKQLYPQAQITAFEPDPLIFEYLQKNLQAQGLEAGISLCPKALWDSEGSLRFLSEGADGGRVGDLSQETQGKYIEIPTVRLRDYLQEPLDFLKLDIEGAETVVLRDCADLLSQVQYLFVEYHAFVGQPQTLAEILHLLSKAGFRYYLQAPGLSSPRPLEEVWTYNGMDMQLNIYARRD